MNHSKTLFEKIWQLHTIKRMEGDNYLIHIDRCYLHDLSGPIAFKMLNSHGLSPLNPSLVYATPDHTISNKPGRTVHDSFASSSFVPRFADYCDRYGITYFDIDHPMQGIIHVIGPESGLTLPGMTVVCGDSHTCTHGAMGALAWGVGTTELYHVLATQTLVVTRPKTMRVIVEGTPDPKADPMDIILHIIAKHGTSFGVGYAVEYAGSAISALSMEGRMTICNLTVEFGSEYGFIAPDEKTFQYIAGRPYAPKGEELKQMIASMKTLVTDEDAVFDKEITVNIDGLKPQISWGISPMHTIDIDAAIPDLSNCPGQEEGQKKALDYMDLKVGQKMLGLPIDKVFIGSCSNGRLSNLQRAAEIVKGKHVAPGIEAWVVPGSQSVKQEAEKLGIDKVFKNSGFVWGEPGCSLCGGCNGEKVAPGKRCVSTSNRNFVGRQGPMARTHLASPSTAALAAVNGVISVSNGEV